jgi:hypothetical protein|tara:strand:- start:1056 stop:1235 length:180 start_codon:yes stop_codon:yes gene_type:complete
MPGTLREIFSEFSNFVLIRQDGEQTRRREIFCKLDGALNKTIKISEGRAPSWTEDTPAT